MDFCARLCLQLRARIAFSGLDATSQGQKQHRGGGF
jgi:hypothetical protein